MSLISSVELGKPWTPGRWRPIGRLPSAFFVPVEIEDDVSKYIERWKELAFLCLGEQDPVKLTELANEMNLAITQKNSLLRSFAARAFRITISPGNHKRELPQIKENAP